MPAGVATSWFKSLKQAEITYFSIPFMKRSPIGPGGVVLFHPMTIHGSLPNRGDRLRWSFDLRYNRTGEVPGRPARMSVISTVGQETRPFAPEFRLNPGGEKSFMTSFAGNNHACIWSGPGFVGCRMASHRLACQPSTDLALPNW